VARDGEEDFGTEAKALAEIIGHLLERFLTHVSGGLFTRRMRAFFLGHTPTKV
jgi:hypothetical protein